MQTQHQVPMAAISDSVRTPPIISGLTTEDVQERLAQGAVNRFEARSGRTYLQILRHNVFNIFNLLLFTLLLIVLLSQDYWTVLFAGFSVVTNSLIGTVQEIQAKRKLNQLANLAPQTAQVLRDGRLQTIDNRDIVRDEVVYIVPGDRVVVDGEVLHADTLEVDEAQITGESDSIHKATGDQLVSGSFCIAGTGYMRATRVGASSTVNRLTATAKRYRNTLTPTQQRIATIVKFTLVILTVFGPMVFISGLRSDSSFLDIVRNTIVFSTSLVPQGLVLASTIALTLGAVKISMHKTLVQRVNAVESMANVTVLCFDKTGTLTQNKLAVDRILPLAGQTQTDLRRDLNNYIRNLAHHNTTAHAILTHLDKHERPATLAKKYDEVPFTSIRKWGAITLRDSTYYFGAPERLFDDEHREQVDDLAARGYRVLAFARSDYQPGLDAHHIDADLLEPLALIVISDQVREDSPETLTAFMAQGIRPKVISGDNLRTVMAVAKAAGMDTTTARTGKSLEALPQIEFEQAVQETDVFARIEPDTKKRIIAALRHQGEYVAMVGDGVNDVPALKEADLAIVMNDGAQISKDIADIVLLNNAMSTLPLALKEGRETTLTMFGSTKMFLTKNFYNTVLFIFTYFLLLPFPITPIQISWAAFGTANIPGGLIALGLIRPERIRSFRDDVMDYIITAGFVGAVGMAFTYLVAFRYLEGDLAVARSVTTLFFILYSLKIFLYVCGVDIAQPRTYLRYPLATVITLVLTSGALIAATLFPDVFEFTWPPAEILVLIGVMFVLCSMVVSVGMRSRGLIRQIYSLVEPDRRAQS